jgi:polysaccharide export outer membrane protein
MISRRLLLTVPFVFMLACASTGPYVWARELPPETNAMRTLAPGDKIQVVVTGQETLSGEFEIRPSGDFLSPAIGRLFVTNMTTDQLAAELTRRLTGVLAAPRVSVVLVSRAATSVSVIGEVKSPGRYELKDGEGLLDALARAGGLTPFAKEDSIYVIRRNRPGPRVRYRYRDLTAPLTGGPTELRYGDVVVVE